MLNRLAAKGVLVLLELLNSFQEDGYVGRRDLIKVKELCSVFTTWRHFNESDLEADSQSINKRYFKITDNIGSNME